MTEPGSSSLPEDSGLASERISRAVTAYVDRLNAGERIEPLEVIASRFGDRGFAQSRLPPPPEHTDQEGSVFRGEVLVP